MKLNLINDNFIINIKIIKNIDNFEKLGIPL